MIALLSPKPVYRLAVQHWVAWSCLQVSVGLQTHRRGRCLCASGQQHFRHAIDDLAHAAVAAHTLESQQRRH